VQKAHMRKKSKCSFSVNEQLLQGSQEQKVKFQDQIFSKF